MAELVRDLADAHRSLAEKYRLFYSKRCGGEGQDLRLGEFRDFANFIKWLCALDVSHDTKRNRKINLKLGLPIRHFLWESMYGCTANHNSRVVRLKPIAPVAYSNETKYLSFP